MKISKTSRVLSAYHLFLNCEEVSFQEFTLNFGVSQRTALRDIRLLKQAGVLEARWNRKRQAFIPVTLEPFPLEQLGIPARRNSRKLMESLPAPPRFWPDVPPENRHLAQLYWLTRAVFYQLEETR